MKERRGSGGIRYLKEQKRNSISNQEKGSFEKTRHQKKGGTAFLRKNPLISGSQNRYRERPQKKRQEGETEGPCHDIRGKENLLSFQEKKRSHPRRYPSAYPRGKKTPSHVRRGRVENPTLANRKGPSRQGRKNRPKRRGSPTKENHHRFLRGKHLSQNGEPMPTVEETRNASPGRLMARLNKLGKNVQGGRGNKKCKGGKTRSSVLPRKDKSLLTKTEGLAEKGRGKKGRGERRLRDRFYLTI